MTQEIKVDKNSKIEKQLGKIRNRQSYREWQTALKFLDGEPTKVEILRFMDGLLNGHSAYGSISKACYSRESLDQMLRDNTKVLCKTCGWSGVQSDCGFGHDDFYCPECGKESIEAEEPKVIEVAPVFRCPNPDCGAIMVSSSGFDQTPEHLFCPVCLDKAYDTITHEVIAKIQ